MAIYFISDDMQISLLDASYEMNASSDFGDMFQWDLQDHKLQAMEKLMRDLARQDVAAAAANSPPLSPPTTKTKIQTHNLSPLPPLKPAHFSNPADFPPRLTKRQQKEKDAKDADVPTKRKSKAKNQENEPIAGPSEPRYTTRSTGKRNG
ncbi:hypothetical protein DFH06DRAFT_1369121 [Mycena polygramma]|nr:hypothetical protein DFH06DRAFT_1369121 [Mycena polygramma]